MPLKRSHQILVADDGAGATTALSSWRRTPFSRPTRIAAVCFALVAFVVTQRHATGGSSLSLSFRVKNGPGPEEKQTFNLFPFSSATNTPVPHVLYLRSLEQNNGDDGAANQQGNNERKRDTHHLYPAEKEQILIMNPDFITLRSELIQQEKFTPRSKIIALCCVFFCFYFPKHYGRWRGLQKSVGH